MYNAPAVELIDLTLKGVLSDPLSASKNFESSGLSEQDETINLDPDDEL